MLTPASILQHHEVLTVLKRLKKLKSMAARRRLMVFRLSCCCGLRATEICMLNRRDIITEGPMPMIDVINGKGGKRRQVPLWWDSGTLADIKDHLEATPGGPGDPLLPNKVGGRYNRHTVAQRWRTAMRALGPLRASQLSIHSGRRTFCSHALYAGHNIVSVRDAMGHSSIMTTNLYLYLVLDDKPVPDLFGEKQATIHTRLAHCGGSQPEALTC